ncbi:MAG: glycosyltransferase family 4 protein [Alphaproteobacteria bacterium]|nr:glycosyltransferase family 4 protein [Alphaproteobacteria bacterium]
MPVAIHYTAIQPPTGREPALFGLQIAIADWLRAYFRYGRAEKFTFLIGDKQEWVEVQSIAAQAGIDAARLVALDRRFPEQNNAQFDLVFRPEPDTRGMLWQRQIGGAYVFCGLAHAISGTEAGEVLQNYCLAPSEETDAIICPSRAVQAAVQAFWANYADYLKMRFGAAYQCPVQTPVIPLGVDIERFEQRVTPEKRSSQRMQLGIGAEDIVLLWVGRLSAAIKAHPLTMFRAVEQAAQKTGAKTHLLMVGYFMPDEAAAQFRKMADDFCKNVKVTFIAANDARFADGLWAAGDIFLSLVDNMQESFGLTPIEAMAAGLPRVVSDWDGYRDSVTDGEDGFLIRTTQPPPGNGFDLTAQVLSGREVYGGFLAKAALTVAVDTEQAAERIAQLIEDKNLRATMADKARARAKATYDWKHIIPAYENLWDELATKRRATPPPAQKWAAALPTLPDPYTMYEAYPTACLSEGDRLALAATFEDIRLLWEHPLNMYANDVFIAPAELSGLIGRLAEKGPLKIGDIMQQFPVLERARLWRTLGWLLKLGIFRFS